MVEDKLGLGANSGVVEISFVGRQSMEELFRAAERRGIRYVLIAGHHHERKGTVDCHLLLQKGRTESMYPFVPSFFHPTSAPRSSCSNSFNYRRGPK